MSIDETTRNDPIRQQRLANITCSKCGQKGHFRKENPNSIGTSPVPDQTSIYSAPTTMTQMATASYVVPQSILVTILKELAKAKQMN